MVVLCTIYSTDNTMAHGTFGGYSNSQQVDLPRGPNDDARIGGFWKILLFTLLGTTVWSVLATLARAGFGPNSALGIAGDAMGLLVAIALFGNLTLGFFEPATTLADAGSNIMTGRRFTPFSKDNGWFMSFAFLLMLFVVQVGGEALGQALAWGFFSGKPNDLGLARYPADWSQGHKFGAEIILMFLWVWLAHLASYKMYGQYRGVFNGKNATTSANDSEDNDMRWAIPNWGRAIIVAVIRATIAIAAASRGAAMLNPARYFITALYTNTWPTAGVFLAAGFVAAAGAALVGGLLEVIELSGKYETTTSPIYDNRVARDRVGSQVPVQGGNRRSSSNALFGSSNA